MMVMLVLTLLVVIQSMIHTTTHRKLTLVRMKLIFVLGQLDDIRRSRMMILGGICLIRVLRMVKSTMLVLLQLVIRNFGHCANFIYKNLTDPLSFFFIFKVL